MRKQKPWRVRVVRKVEDWVEVHADNPLQAEQLAVVLPMVISVFGGSAIRGDKPVDFIPAAGVIDDEDEQQ